MQPSAPDGELTVAYERAGFQVSAWTGGAGAGPFQQPASDAFVATAAADHAVRTAYAFSGWRVVAEAGSGRRLSPDHAGTRPDRTTPARRWSGAWGPRRSRSAAAR
ncbi:MAG: hypothetical protein WDN45_01455 [Caulobacteraceae bacterium]